MAWGLVPSWTKMGDKLDFFRMFNARSETVPEKSVFSRLLGAKRCIVPLNGFYEWAQVRVLRAHAAPPCCSNQCAHVPTMLHPCLQCTLT